MSSMFGPPLDVVTMCVAWTNVLDMTPDPMSTHIKSLDLISLVLTFGPGWRLRLLISLWGFGWLAAACAPGKLYETVAALPFATAVCTPISGDDDDSEICSDDSDDEPPNLDSLAIAQLLLLNFL